MPETTPRSLAEFARCYDPGLPFEEIARLAYALLGRENAEGLLSALAERDRR